MNNELKELYVTLVEAGLDKEAAILEKYLVKEAKDGKGPLGRIRQKMQDRRETKQELKPALKEMEKGKAFARQVAQEVLKGNIKRVAPGDYMIIHYNRLDRGFFRVLQKFKSENPEKVSMDEENGRISRIQIGDPEVVAEIDAPAELEPAPVEEPTAPAPAEPAPAPAPEPATAGGPPPPSGSFRGISRNYAYMINTVDQSFTWVWLKGEDGQPNQIKNIKIRNNSANVNMQEAWCKLKSFYLDQNGGKGFTAQGTGASVPDISSWTHTVPNACGTTTWETE